MNATVQQRKPKTELKVSAYDQVSSMLLAMIMMVGFFVTLMFLVWLTTVLIFGRAPIEVEYIEEIAGRGEHAEGYERDLEEPGEEELDELIEPQLEAALVDEEDVEVLLDAGLSRYGRDPRALVAGGVQSLLEMRGRHDDPLEGLLKLLLG